MNQQQCPQCGVSIPTNPNAPEPSSFCAACGARLVLPAGPPPPPDAPFCPPQAASAVAPIAAAHVSGSSGGRSRPKLILAGFLWSVAIYFVGSILMVAMVIAVGGKDAADTPMAIKSALVVIALIILLSPLVVIWLTAKGMLPGTRKP
jgi:hypothetical protein